MSSSMRQTLGLLSIALAACGPKADSAPSEVPGDADATDDDFGDEDAADDADADDDAAPPAAAGPTVYKVTLHNLCDKPQAWVIIDGDVTPDPSAGQEIAPGATVEIELGPQQYVVYKDASGNWAGRARSDSEGGHVWMSSTCDGIGSSDDPAADPAKIDKNTHEMLEKAKAAGG